MNPNLLFSLILAFIMFVLVILVYTLFINKRRKNMKTEGNFTEPSYLIKRFNLNTRKISYNKIMWTTTIINAFIMALTIGVVVNIESLILQLLAAFVMLFVLIFIAYEILGRIYVSKGYTKKSKEEDDK